MSQSPTVLRERRFRAGSPPIPREHGAWVILYAPLIIGFAVSGRFAMVPALLLILAVTGAYLGRNAADVALRRRDPGARFWLVVFLLALAGGAVPLLVVFHRTDLIMIGAAVCAIFGIHAVLSLRRARKRFDRTTAGELLAVAALVSTGPAASVALRGSFDSRALWLWLLCALFFGSGVLHVNMYLDAAKVRGEFSGADRAGVSRPSLLYHLSLLAAFPLTAYLALRSPSAAVIAVAGIVPVLVRAFRGAATVSNTLPPLKRVGLQETLNALWFTVFLIAAYWLSPA